jgi:hypothetical protein
MDTTCHLYPSWYGCRCTIDGDARSTCILSRSRECTCTACLASSSCAPPQQGQQAVSQPAVPSIVPSACSRSESSSQRCATGPAITSRPLDRARYHALTLLCIALRTFLGRFSASEGVSGSSLAKSSVSRNIKKSILESYPQLEPSEELSHLDNILGDKKQPLYVIKWYEPQQDHNAVGPQRMVASRADMIAPASPRGAVMIVCRWWRSIRSRNSSKRTMSNGCPSSDCCINVSQGEMSE